MRFALKSNRKTRLLGVSAVSHYPAGCGPGDLGNVGDMGDLGDRAGGSQAARRRHSYPDRARAR